MASERVDSRASTDSSDDGDDEAFDFLEEEDEDAPPSTSAPPPAAAPAAQGVAGASASAPTPRAPFSDTITAPDWMLMLRRVFEAAQLSEARLGRFVECLGVLEFNDGASIVRQGEIG